MKKLLSLCSIAGLFLPGLVLAATADVTLDTTVALSVNSITLNVSGSTASIESIAVDSTNFTAVLQAGSGFKISAPSLNQLSYDILNSVNSQASNVNHICTSAASTIEVSAVSASTTLIVTPSSALCADAVVAASSGSSKGSATPRVTPVPVATVPQSAEITALMAQIASLQAQIAGLSGVTLPSIASATAKAVLTANLSKGSRSASVKGLQQFLNTHGFVIASSGPGSVGKETDMFGNLTVKAVQKFQEQYGIATPSTPGYGNVGPKTRAKINELSQ